MTGRGDGQDSPEQGHATARHIERVASGLFADRGFAATPVRAIAEAAGVTCPTLYYHFKSKEGLAQELLTRPSSEVVAALRRLLSDAALDPLGRVVRMVDAMLDFSRAAPERARFLYAVMFGPADECLAAEAEAFVREINALLDEATGRLEGAGILAPGRAPDLTKALRGLVVIHTMDFLYRDGTLPPDLADRIVRDQLLGLAGPEARPGPSGRPPDALPG
ncbi:TetR/AcrR family transcriptional regulator [Tautonia plasticadhaerens]|uniref:HTH-type transcriptional repressor KstR2 n=1 Tax=Tautonia plasticadhaerens TaxID=2527974 RepID=A0A518GUG6_9BACT|nr:TetR/AcrR family transcriptional regulator [Tautonia plasticadhaerens]QDV32221.1 HTH-type transcriptional repressor KstR2 [Tautonia plasticadhaerens]